MEMVTAAMDDGFAKIGRVQRVDKARADQLARGLRAASAPSYRRSQRAECRKLHIAEFRKRAAEAEAKLKRFYDAIEKGIADLHAEGPHYHGR
jgi:hypothetical protein